MKVRDFEFRGRPYKVACVEDYPDHPTWFTFVDESDVRERFWRIRPGDVVLDVGAAFGSYAVTALAAGASRVWAWAPEGIPGSVSEVGVLRATLELNGWSDRCEVLTNGVYDRDGWLHTKTQEFSRFLTFEEASAVFGEQDVVCRDCIDSLCAKHQDKEARS